jgi:hypothetical protein
MSLQLINSNHTSGSETSELEAALGRLIEAKSAIGCPDGVLVRARDYYRLVREANELRRLQALADARLLGDAADRPPARPWTVSEMAKQLGLSPAAVRRRKSKWAFTRCVAHENCRGGTRGCDLRFVAAEASSWVNSQRRRGAAR